MIVVKNKSELDGVKKLHDYLYDMSADNYELLEIYEQIDEEVDSLENDLISRDEDEDFEGQVDEMTKDIKDLINNFKKFTRTEILDELERIIF